MPIRDSQTGFIGHRIILPDEQCEWCGESVPNGTRFIVTHGFSEGPFYVAECCGVRETGLIKPEHAGPLLKKKGGPYADYV